MAINIEITGVQEELVSGQNIKSINGKSLLESGDLPIADKIQIFDNSVAPGNFGLSVSSSGLNLNISWTGIILLSYNFDPSASGNRYAHLIASSGTRTVQLNDSTQTTAYIKKSEFTSATAEVIPIHYCRWDDDILKQDDTFILITKNKSTSLKDCTGPLAEFIQNNLVDSRLTALETSSQNVVTASDNEAQNLFLRGHAIKDYSTTKKYGIIAAGQSNMDGRVPQVDAPVWLNQSNPELLGVNMWNRGVNAYQTFKLGVNTGADINTTTLWAHDMVVYHLLQQYLNDDIYVVKRTRGGAAIAADGTNGGGYWNAYFERVPSGIVLMDSLENELRTAIAANSNVEFKAFIWHQGEGDSINTAPDNYYQNFKNVIAYVRGIVNNPKLPVVCSSVSTLSAQYNTTVKAAQQQIANEDPFVFFIDNTNRSLLDPYHFNAASSEALGTDVFNLIKDF